MKRTKVTEQELGTFLDIADRLQIDVRGLLTRDVSFREMELAGHQLGQAIAQITIEHLSAARAERISEHQSCPACGTCCPVTYKERDLVTGDGPIRLLEPVCHCSTCRRDFFPSASCTGT